MSNLAASKVDGIIKARSGLAVGPEPMVSPGSLTGYWYRCGSGMARGDLSLDNPRDDAQVPRRGCGLQRQLHRPLDGNPSLP